MIRGSNKSSILAFRMTLELFLLQVERGIINLARAKVQCTTFEDEHRTATVSYSELPTSS